MVYKHPARRFFAGFGLILVVLLIGFAIANQFIPTWGSTAQEQAQTLPGDEIFGRPVLAWTNAISIHASPEDVWPWLVQMGDTRAGYYSYRYIEKAITAAAGVDAARYYPNTNTIHPEWQNPAAGQGMIMDVLVLRDYQPGRYMVAGPNPSMGDAGLAWTWAISPDGKGGTHLVVHMRIQIPGAEGNQLVQSALNLTTFMMERKMMEGIKLRAEGGSEADWVQAAEALIWLVTLGLGIASSRRFITRASWVFPLAGGLAAVVLLFVFTYLQPALWLRTVSVIALAGLLAWDIRSEKNARNSPVLERMPKNQ